MRLPSSASCCIGLMAVALLSLLQTASLTAMHHLSQVTLRCVGDSSPHSQQCIRGHTEGKCRFYR